MKVQHISAQETCCTFMLHFQIIHIKQKREEFQKGF